MSDNIDFTTITPGTAKVIRLGSRKIMFGQATASNIPSGTEKLVNVTYPEIFSNTPTVIASVASWVGKAAVEAWADTASPTRTFSFVVRHEHGNNQSVKVNWIAIG